MEQKRQTYLDLVKLFAILIVVFRHCMQKYVVNYEYGALSNAIWLIQMPIFFVVSGILSPNKDKFPTTESFFISLLKKIFVYLWPIVTFTIISAWTLNQSPESLGGSFVGFFQDPTSNLWFLWVLFWCVALFDVSIFVSSRFHNESFSEWFPLITSFVVLCVLLVLYYFKAFSGEFLGLKLWLFYLPFYSLGYSFRIFKKWKLFSGENTKLRNVVVWVSLGVFMFSYLFISFYFPSVAKFDDSNVFYVAIRIFGSLCGSLLFIVVFYYLSRFQFLSKISKGGRFTLECYYFHILINRLIPSLSEGTAVAIQWGYVFGLFFFLIAVTAVAIIISYFVPFLHLLVWGKSWSKYSFEKQFVSKLKVVPYSR